MNFDDKVEAEFGRYYCRRCADRRIAKGAEERYSMGVYAGMLCDACWDADGRNHDRAFDPLDAGEHYGEEDY
jgi:hypothetical protein